MNRFWLIHHNADLTETGAPQRRTYLQTRWDGFPSQRSCELEIVRDWCRQRFGNEVAYVQGVAATRNWIVEESTEDAFHEARPIIWGGHKTETRQVILGIGNLGYGAYTVYSDMEV